MTRRLVQFLSCLDLRWWVVVVVGDPVKAGGIKNNKYVNQQLNVNWWKKLRNWKTCYREW